jgi:threonine dehydratase/serine racemase
VDARSGVASSEGGMSAYAADLAAVRAAAARIDGRAQRTPVATCTTLDQMAGRSLFFKCEQYQKGGSFKFRGACNAVLKLSDADAARGVATHSSGNFAQAVALAARARGIAAHVVMPENAPAVKRRAVEGYGARVIPCAPQLAAREATLAKVLAATGATPLHPYDHADVIAGQGTLALELLEQVPELDAILAPVGGGGLLAGIAIAATELRPGIRIFGGEPQGADDAARSMQAGEVIPLTNPDTIADGLVTSLGELTWPVLRDRVEAIVTVSEAEIIAAMRLSWERGKLLIEPSAAVALAAVLDQSFRALRGIDRVGVVLSGGNVDLDRFPW